MSENQEQEDGIIELTEVVDPDSYDSIEDGVIELTEALPVKETKGGDALTKANEADPADVSLDMVEKALENVIEKKFAGKIESILFEVMEKVIEKEIKEIKDSLQKDLDRISRQ